MGELPLVSVLIPMRNGARFVLGAVESVLAQRGARVEVLAIDNASEDGSANIVRGVADPRVRVLSCPEPGIAAALNLGLAQARGGFIARCDADDWYPVDRLAGQMALFAEHPEFDAVCGNYTTMDEGGRVVCTMDCGTRAQEITAELRRGMTRAPLCTFTMRREAVERVGGFRSWFATAEDIDFQMRFGLIGRVYYEPRPVYFCRVHDASITHTQRRAERDFYEQSARLFARQRAENSTDDLERGTPPAPPDGDGMPPRSAAEHIQQLLAGLAWRYHENGQKLLAVRTGLAACLHRPQNVAAWKSLAALLMKRSRRRAPGEAKR